MNSKNYITYFHKVVNFIKRSNLNLSDVTSAWNTIPFEKQSRGRKSGEMDLNSSQRNGKANDYINHLNYSLTKYIEKFQKQLTYFN